MVTIRQLAHQGAVLARLGGRSLGRRLAGNREPVPDRGRFRADFERWIRRVPSSVLAAHRFVELPAKRPPWTDSGVELEPGDQVTVFATGRVHLSRALDIWVPPHFQLWYRIGEKGPVFRGTRSHHSFRANRGGRLYLASYFPGEWADERGSLNTPRSIYRAVSGGMTALVLRWAKAVEAGAALASAAATGSAPPEVRAEAERPGNFVTPPKGWQYLWFLGPAEIFAPAPQDPESSSDSSAIACHTHGDAGILHADARQPLTPQTRLRWQWRVDELPSALAEDTAVTHDYLSIAVEFDNGQDLTYMWSAELPSGTAFRCPLPTWKDRETHVVIRSGTAELGQWLAEERNLYDDYRWAIGEPPGAIRRVWLIANSLFQRREGRAEFRDIQVVDATGTVAPPAEAKSA